MSRQSRNQSTISLLVKDSLEHYAMPENPYEKDKRFLAYLKSRLLYVTNKTTNEIMSKCKPPYLREIINMIIKTNIDDLRVEWAIKEWGLEDDTQSGSAQT